MNHLSKLFISFVLGTSLALWHPMSSAPLPLDILHRTYDATARVYIGDGRGIEPLCTAFNVAKTPDGYELATAAHCVTEDNKYPKADVKIVVSYNDPDLLFLPDLIPAKVLAYGNDKNDVALLLIKTDVIRPVLSLGDSNSVENGDDIISVSAPLGGGLKQLLKGYVSQKEILYPLNVRHEMALQIWLAPGSSGAPVVSLSQGAVIGIETAIYGVGSGLDTYELCKLAHPVSYLKDFIQQHPVQ